MESCIICHEEFKGDSLTISCEKNHTIHYSCYEAWKKEKYDSDFEDIHPKIPCVVRCETFYRDNFRGYIEVFLLSARHELFDICDDILRNKLKGFPPHRLFERAKSNIRAMLFLFEEGHIQWKAEEHLKKIIRDIAGCSDTTIVQRFLEFAWKQGFEPLQVFQHIVELNRWFPRGFAKNGISTIINFLITICEFKPEEHLTLYRLVATKMNEILIEELIKTGRYNLNAQDEDGWTALHFAVKINNDTIVCDLIDAGARMDIRDVNGYNAVDTAYYYHQDDYVHYMVEKGGAMTDAAKRREIE